ncbi:hypothetical protein [Paraburkholderia caledonica]|uniref:hypothetical protein n=1 Tax=Paraburkholderia caledonica TaxID=134536 RepID=UPI0038BDD073
MCQDSLFRRGSISSAPVRHLIKRFTSAKTLQPVAGIDDCREWRAPHLIIVCRDDGSKMSEPFLVEHPYVGMSTAIKCREENAFGFLHLFERCIAISRFDEQTSDDH